MIVSKLSDLQVFVFSLGYDGGPTTYQDSLSTTASSLPTRKRFTATF